jgi:polar amino acid transport system substrate-binding protein
VLRAVFDRLPQYDLEIEVASFDALFGGLSAGNYQIAFNNLSYNESRGESYLFSYPVVKCKYVFVTRPDDDPITSFSDIGGKKFEDGAGVSVTNAVEAWNEANPDQAVDITYTEADMEVQLQHLVDGVTDFKIFDAGMYNAYVNEYNLDLVATPVPDDETDAIASSLYTYYLLPLDQTGLRDEIDAVLKELQADGTLTELTEQYLGSDLAPEADQYNETIN